MQPDPNLNFFIGRATWAQDCTVIHSDLFSGERGDFPYWLDPSEIANY